MKRKLEAGYRGCEALNISSFIEEVDTASQLACRLCNLSGQSQHRSILGVAIPGKPPEKGL